MAMEYSLRSGEMMRLPQLVDFCRTYLRMKESITIVSVSPRSNFCSHSLMVAQKTRLPFATGARIWSGAKRAS